MKVVHHLLPIERPRIETINPEHVRKPDLKKLNEEIKEYLADLAARCDPTDFEAWTFYEFGWSRMEVAELLGLTADAVRQAIRRVEKEQAKYNRESRRGATSNGLNLIQINQRFSDF